MAIYKSKYRRQIAQITPEERLSNQIVIYGTDETMSIPNGAFFLEYLQVDGQGNITILDGDGVIISTGVETFSNDFVPLECPKGFTLTGDVAMAKGFVIEDLYIS